MRYKNQQKCNKQLSVLSYLERYEKYGWSIGEVHSDISTREQKEELVKAWQNHESEQSIKQEDIGYAYRIRFVLIRATIYI